MRPAYTVGLSMTGLLWMTGGALLARGADHECLALVAVGSIAALAIVTAALVDRIHEELRRHDSRVGPAYAALAKQTQEIHQILVIEAESAELLHRRLRNPSGPQPLGPRWRSPYN